MDYARNLSPIRSPIPGRLAPSSRPLKPYNRSHMQPALGSSIPDASLAVFPVNGENSHQGPASRNPAPNQGHEVCNFTVLLGMRAAAVLNRVGSRSPGKERDAESGLDNFGARYYASSMGRWMSPDPSGLEFADPTNPQSFNLYSYSQNNPLTNTDPTGLDCVYFNDAGNGVESVDRNSNSGECGSNGGDWINGRVQSAQYFSDSDTFGFRSSDSQNNYLTYANAPGTESDGTTCAGNCDTANGYLQSSNSLPDLTDDQRIQQLSIGITADSQHSFGCIAQAYGVGGPGTAAYQLGQPVAGTKRFVSPGSSLGTSPISDALSKALPVKGRFPAPVGGPGTGVPFRMTKTGNLGRALGRWAPFVGVAADAYAAGQLWNCLGGH